MGQEHSVTLIYCSRRPKFSKETTNIIIKTQGWRKGPFVVERTDLDNQGGF